MDQPIKPGMVGIFRCVASAISIFVGLQPVLGHAQTNIDQGKSPAEIFANDCATCHKSARGLANGRGSSGLASFLAEHYTASKDQAAALAAYVMGAGGGDTVPAAQGRGAKPAPDHGRAAVEEAKPGAQPARQSGKPEERSPATAKLQPPAVDEPKRLGDVPRIMQEPAGQKPAATATRGRHPEPSAVSAPEPAAAAAPSSASTETSPTIAPSAAAPANADSGESSPVPRDNIPD
jgi:hypothetical protein